MDAIKSEPRVSETAPGSIGSKISASIVDASIADEAVNEDPGCPATACLELFGFPARTFLTEHPSSRGR
jgi:hypothetical protein